MGCAFLIHYVIGQLLPLSFSADHVTSSKPRMRGGDPCTAKRSITKS